MSNDNVIEIQELSRRFGRRTVVDRLTLAVPRGSVFAFLGKNGAGKTTTIRMLLNLLPKTSGAARVLGLDSVKDALPIKRRIGFVADGQMMYEWMSVREALWYCKGFYPGWDDAFAAQLLKRLELPERAKVQTLSRGEQAKLALLLAMAYHPELLILDEPTTGLDVVVRRDFLQGIIELIQEAGRTVFYSTHIVHEVERVADWVGIIDAGRLVCCTPLQTLKASIKRLVLTFDEAVPEQVARIPNLLRCDGTGRQRALIVRDFSEQTLPALTPLQPLHVEVEDLGLEDIFVALVGHPEEA